MWLEGEKRGEINGDEKTFDSEKRSKNKVIGELKVRCREDRGRKARMIGLHRQSFRGINSNIKSF